MSVFGGDSWAREAQHRKRRVDTLLSSSLPAPSSSPSYKKLSNGKLACLVCPNAPVVDSPLMLSVHCKGSRHLAAEARRREKEQSLQEEISKRVALSSSEGTSVMPSDSYSTKKETPLIQKTLRAVKEAVKGEGCDNRELGFMKEAACGLGGDSGSGKNRTDGSTEVDPKVLAEWRDEQRKRRRMELKFTAAGWKRDGHGKWYRDENVEFDSDEEDPNEFFA